MSDITIVTAYFDINRSEWNNFNRSSNQYIDYFKFWAGIKNNMIIYTEKKYEKIITTIRKTYGNDKKTQVIVIEDIKKLDTELYSRMSNAAINDNPKKFRILHNNPEVWNVDYNYIMMLKPWFVKDAIDRGMTSETIAWVDFGFNHGGKYYTKPEEFNFLWNYKFSDKINIFTLKDLDSEPIYNITRNMDAYITAGMIVGPSYLWGEFWRLMRKCMISLNRVGLMDDDQTIILMSIREKPEIFDIHKSYWFTQFKEFGGEHLTVRENSIKKKNIFIELKNKISRYSYKMNKSIRYGIEAFRFSKESFDNL